MVRLNFAAKVGIILELGKSSVQQAVLVNTSHHFQQTSIRIHNIISHLTCRSIVEEFLRTFNLGQFHAFQLHGIHAAFGFSDEEHMLDAHVVVEGNGPVGSVVAHWCWNVE